MRFQFVQEAGFLSPAGVTETFGVHNHCVTCPTMCLNPTNACRSVYVTDLESRSKQDGSLNLWSMCTRCRSKRLGCCEGTRRCHTSGISEKPLHAGDKGTQVKLDLKPSSDITRSPKQRYQWPQKKTYVAPLPPKKIMKSAMLSCFCGTYFVHEHFGSGQCSLLRTEPNERSTRRTSQ